MEINIQWFGVQIFMTHVLQNECILNIEYISLRG